MADSMNVAGVLYQKCVPGLCATGSDRNNFTSGSVDWNENFATSSACCPLDMVSRSCTRIALRFSPGPAGASSGKNFSTSSSTLNFPSATASPTAVEVKLLLNEYIECGVAAANGDHQPSATT